MYVDANGQVHDGTDPAGFNPLEQGHRLSYGGESDGEETLQERFERAADNAAAFARDELSMNITVPTAVKVAAGVVVVGIVALPVGAMVLSWLAARNAARVAAAAAPYVVEAGPVIMAAVPEAAPVVAAASVVNAVHKARAGQAPPAEATQLVGTLRTIPREARADAEPATPIDTAARAPAEEPNPNRAHAGELLGALRTIAKQSSLRVEVDGVPVRAELMKSKEHV